MESSREKYVRIVFHIWINLCWIGRSTERKSQLFVIYNFERCIKATCCYTKSEEGSRPQSIAKALSNRGSHWCHTSDAFQH
ncbi:hypothetical protein E6O75_ATG09396 [Venturia nashicola]|uniref:Uncharacterized protein n=1 Tax=Venturia nashicola TaxID=86259 RepID=A0A4Z1NFV2_9PEZI|nr:hypothetical protein E6O75_ATG09396 [Venturia nashicola]